MAGQSQSTDHARKRFFFSCRACLGKMAATSALVLGPSRGHGVLSLSSAEARLAGRALEDAKEGAQTSLASGSGRKPNSLVPAVPPHTSQLTTTLPSHSQSPHQHSQSNLLHSNPLKSQVPRGCVIIIIIPNRQAVPHQSNRGRSKD